MLNVAAEASTQVEGRNGYHGARVGIVGAGVTGIAAAALLGPTACW